MIFPFCSKCLRLQTAPLKCPITHLSAEINPAPDIQVALFIRPNAIFSHVAFYAFHFLPVCRQELCAT